MKKQPVMPYIGCAGWSVPASVPTLINIDENGSIPVGQLATATETNTGASKAKSHLERYCEIFKAVEINSSFYRSHMPKTYVRWRETVSPEFRFSVKLPREITHYLRLENCDSELQRFMFEAGHLEDKLGILLIQTPPSLEFNYKITSEFLSRIRNFSNVAVAWEPRHSSWFEADVFQLLEQYNVTLVHADPPPVKFKMANLPQTSSTTYIRLHGSPVMYSSSYDRQYLEELSTKLLLISRESAYVWCIFDNTAQGAAFQNAMTLRTILRI